MPELYSSRFCRALLNFSALTMGLFLVGVCQVNAQEKSLVDRLSEGDHPVEAILRPEKTVERFKEAIDRNYVTIKFTDTRGGTELGMRLDKNACKFEDADFEIGEGTVHLEGLLTLNYVKVRLVADIELATLEGTGHLVKIDDSP